MAARKWGKTEPQTIKRMVNANGICMTFYFRTLVNSPHSISLCSITNPPSSSSSTFVITWEMESMEAKALKSSFRLKLGAKSTHPATLEDSCACNGTNAGAGEDFAVEEFFNFSNGDLEQWSSVEAEEEDESEKDRLSVSSLDPVDDSNSTPASFSAAGDEDSLLSELAVPGDDLAALEWVSYFVDDSLLEFSLLQPAMKTKPQTRPEVESRPIVSGVSCLSSPIPAKPRTKKARTSGRVWPGSLLSDSSSSSSSSGFTGAPCLSFNNSGQDMENCHAVAEPPAKKQQKKSADEARGSASGTQLQRRCSHCQVQKTPQWRTGPLGAKTLCNACGVRYKSGRLFPEYRPACSPTFSGDIHSNSHRKVLELRKRKDTDAPASGFGRMVPSF